MSGKWSKKGKNPIVKSTLTRQNMHKIYDLVSYLKDLGVKRYFLLHEDIIGRQKIMPCFSFPGFREFYIKLKDNFAGTLDIGSVAASGFYKYGLNSPGKCDAGLQKIAICRTVRCFPAIYLRALMNSVSATYFRTASKRYGTSPILEQFQTFMITYAREMTAATTRIAAAGARRTVIFFMAESIFPTPDAQIKILDNNYFNLYSTLKSDTIY